MGLRGGEGSPGPKGDIGYSISGNQGAKGYPGVPGDVGRVGRKGDPGDNGIPGLYVSGLFSHFTNLLSCPSSFFLQFVNYPLTDVHFIVSSTHFFFGH